MPKVSTTKIVVDGKEYVVPVMKFKTLKKAYPIMEKLEESDDLIAMSEAAHEVISLALRQDPANEHMTAEWIGENIDVDENVLLAEAITGMLKDSGLIPKEGGGVQLAAPGEAEAAEDAASTGTLTPSSQSLSQPDVAEEIGTP